MAGETEVALIHLHRNRGQTQKKTGECQSDRTYRQLAVILWRPRTCLLIQHKEKRKYKRGEEEEKTRHRCEASLTQAHRQDDETVEKDITTQ